MTKASTLGLIPNAIHIITVTGEKHIFASFYSRDKSFEVMSNIWNAVMTANGYEPIISTAAQIVYQDMAEAKEVFEHQPLSNIIEQQQAYNHNSNSSIIYEMKLSSSSRDNNKENHHLGGSGPKQASLSPTPLEEIEMKGFGDVEDGKWLLHQIHQGCSTRSSKQLAIQCNS